MPHIQLLDDDLINKIAAGEVIERPSSVVKELVENAVDAGATRIAVHIENCGKKLIQITDNGHGMDEENAKKSIIRHATSKIHKEDDLFSIHTLGFRGEALATIAAVSQMSIITKPEEGVEGFNIIVEGGLVVSSGIIAAEQGTSIEVRNLFYNTPARKKFLKTDAVELRHIIDVVTQYALANPSISFSLQHEKHSLLNAPQVQDQRSNIASIYGTQLAKELLEITYKDDHLTLTGFIGKPSQARNDKHQQILFVNNRAVKNVDISNAVHNAYHSMLFHGKYPIFFLSLTLDPFMVDVNVHPQKHEIKIDQIDMVKDVVMDAVNTVLKENNLIPTLNLEFEQPSSFVQKETKYSFEKSKQQVLDVEERNHTESIPTESSESMPPVEVYHDDQGQEVEPTPQIPVKNSLPDMKLFGQMHKTFFIAETEGGAFFIDQHAAHERVMYEQFMVQLLKKQVATQRLLQGGMMDVSPSEKILIDTNKAELEQFGYLLEEFGQTSYVIKTVPSIFGRLQPLDSVKEMISSLEKGNSIMELKETIITRMACRSAVMAGDELTNTWMQSILNELNRCDHPYTCPHGRPTIIKITADELEKKFKRRG